MLSTTGRHCFLWVLKMNAVSAKQLEKHLKFQRDSDWELHLWLIHPHIDNVYKKSFL